MLEPRPKWEMPALAQIIGAVSPHISQVGAPSSARDAHFRKHSFDLFQCGRPGFGQGTLNLGRCLVEREGLARLDSNAPHLVEDRVVVRVRRVEFGELGEQREICRWTERFDLIDGPCLHVPVGIDLSGRRLVRLPPLAERGGVESGLEFAHRVVVGFAVRLRAPADPADRRGAINERRVCRELALPTWPSDRQHLRACAGRSLARGDEHVGPHVEHRQHVVAAPRIRHADQQRFLRHVEPHQRIERVDVRPHHILVGGVGKCRKIHKLVHRRLT